jgi:hypothetical protein
MMSELLSASSLMPNEQNRKNLRKLIYAIITDLFSFVYINTIYNCITEFTDRGVEITYSIGYLKCDKVLRTIPKEVVSKLYIVKQAVEVAIEQSGAAGLALWHAS